MKKNLTLGTLFFIFLTTATYAVTVKSGSSQSADLHAVIDPIMKRLVEIYSAESQQINKDEKNVLHGKLISFGDRAITVLEQYFTSDEAMNRVVALYALEDILKDKAISYIHQGLDDSSGDVRLVSVYLSSRYKSKLVFDYLVKILENDPDEKVRMLAMAAIGDYRNEESARILNEKSHDSNPNISKAANIMINKLAVVKNKETASTG